MAQESHSTRLLDLVSKVLPKDPDLEDPSLHALCLLHPPSAERSVLTNCQSLLDSETFSDCRIHTCDCEVEAHMAYLSRSEFFHSTEGTKSLVLPDSNAVIQQMRGHPLLLSNREIEHLQSGVGVDRL